MERVPAMGQCLACVGVGEGLGPRLYKVKSETGYKGVKADAIKNNNQVWFNVQVDLEVHNPHAIYMWVYHLLTLSILV